MSVNGDEAVDAQCSTISAPLDAGFHVLSAICYIECPALVDGLVAVAVAVHAHENAHVYDV